MGVLCPSKHFFKSVLNFEQDRGFYWQFWAQPPRVSGRNGFPNVHKPTQIIKLKLLMCIIHDHRLIFIKNLPLMAIITSFNQI